MGGYCLATPAISDGMLFVRTSKHVFGIGRTADKGGSGERANHGEPAEQLETPPAKVPVAAAAGGLTDPVEILKRVDAVAKAVKTVRYDVEVELTGAATRFAGSLKATVLASGFVDGMPERFLVEAEVVLPGTTEPRRLTGGSDGNTYYVIDHANKTAHEDLEPSVMGPYRRALARGVMIEFFHPEPFSAEINGKQHELRGSEMIGGEDCWEINVVYAGEGDQSATWLVSKRDFLPRGRRDVFRLPSGDTGGLKTTITNLVVAPDLTPDALKLKLPPGYVKTDTPAQ